MLCQQCMWGNRKRCAPGRRLLEALNAWAEGRNGAKLFTLEGELELGLVPVSNASEQLLAGSHSQCL